MSRTVDPLDLEEFAREANKGVLCPDGHEADDFLDCGDTLVRLVFAGFGESADVAIDDQDLSFSVAIASIALIISLVAGLDEPDLELALGCS